jgi:NADP-dependent 3-hydroxy acid dehydrogenase YdfG
MVILISGGTRGIGRAISEVLLKDGHSLVTFCPFPEELKEFEGAIPAFCNPAKALVLSGDVTREDQVAEIVEKTIGRFGRIDVLINNAGVLYYEECDAVDIAQFKRTIDVNLVGPAILTKAVVPLMKKQGGGQIINTVSTAGKHTGERGEFYAATKYGVMGYSQGIRAELRPFKIKVATVCPGITKTDAISPKEMARRPSDDKAMLEASEVARTVKFIVDQPAGSDIRDILITPFGSNRYHF